MSKTKQESTPEVVITQEVATSIANTEINTNPVRNYNNIPPKSLNRNKFGLLENADYFFDPETGLVDWRKMIPPQHLYINSQNVEKIEKKYGKKIDEISIVDDKVDDCDLVIKISGIKALAFIRGFTGVSYKIHNASENYAAASCDITWIANFETPEAKYGDEKVYREDVYFSGLGSATPITTNKMTRNYLVEMAENRAFCRAVRGFLRLSVVSSEELQPKSLQVEEDNSTAVSPRNLLSSILKEKNISFDKLKATLTRKAKNDEETAEIAAYNEITDIPVFKILDIIGKIKRKEEEAKA